MSSRTGSSVADIVPESSGLAASDEREPFLAQVKDDGSDSEIPRAPKTLKKTAKQAMSSAMQHDGGVSIYERKCALVNREIDRMAMGPYQWMIFGLCGFGYLLDLLWAQCFGLILSPLSQEFGFEASQSGQISTAFSAGLTVGAIFWGILIDIVGRQWAFNLTVLISSTFGLGLGGTESYTVFLILTALVGFGIGGNIPIDTTITLEFIPQKNRRLLPFLSIFQPIGVVVCTAIAYGFIPTNSCKPDWTNGDSALQSCALAGPNVQPPDCCGKQNNMGWRYTLFTVGGITLGCFVLRIVFFRFRESPKFLISRGRDDKAVKVLQQIANFNSFETNITIADFAALDDEEDSVDNRAATRDDAVKHLPRSWMVQCMRELERYKVLFFPPVMARLTILVFLTYACDYWGFTLAGTYVPTILARKNRSLNLTIQETYRSYIWIYLPGILGVLAGVQCYDLKHVGRKWTMTIASGLMGASLFLFATVNDQASNIGLNIMEYFFQSMFNSVLYGWTPEAFPAAVRGSACGLASFCGRLAGILAPIIGQTLVPPADAPAEDFYKLLYLAGGVTFGCVVFTALLPGRLIGKDSV